MQIRLLNNYTANINSFVSDKTCYNFGNEHWREFEVQCYEWIYKARVMVTLTAVLCPEIQTGQMRSSFKDTIIGNAPHNAIRILIFFLTYNF